MGTVDEGAVAKGFTTTAADYDEAVRFNIAGARRLVRSLPPGLYDEILDVGCGTGFASLEMVDNLGTRRIDGVDPAAGMLEQFRAKLAGRPGVEVTLHEADVEDMPVPAGAFDAVKIGRAHV